MQRGWITTTAIALLTGLTGCPAEHIPSEQGQWMIDSSHLVTGAHQGFGGDGAVLTGTPFCSIPTFQGEVPEGFGTSQVLADCVEQSIAGPAGWDDSCLLLEEAGEVTWYLDPTDCPLQESGLNLQADRIVFEVADPAQVQAEVQQWVEDYAVESLQLDPASPAGWTNPPGDPFRLMAQQRVLLYLRLTDPETGGSVAWKAEDGAISATARAGSFQRTDSGEDAGWVGLVLGEGAQVDLELAVNDRSWAAGTVEAVDRDAPASLEIVAGYFIGDGDAEQRAPFGARAVVRDANGALIYGTPVTWKVTDGALSVAPGSGNTADQMPGADYAVLADVCVDPVENDGERTVVLEASYGELTDSLELTWTVQAGSADETWEPGEQCQYGGCQCRTASTSGRVALTPWMALVGLLMVRLRRR